jgi:adenylyltransferase/sulfurtransferase
LLVGAGGLGSPVALYLAACGIGCLGIIDHDIVEMNNLHRQVIHTEGNIGQSKVKSAAEACRAINSTLKIVEYIDALTTANALDIVSKYDIVVDATDNVSTRYLINDCCVILGKPLVSGAALGLEGQLTVYHQNQGPCYRCLFPTPPPMDACQRCSDNGVLGVKLRGRSLKCIACGDRPEISYESFQNFDYEKFTQSPMSDKAPSKLCLIPSSQRSTSKEFREQQESGKPYVLLDVREDHQYKIAALPNSINIPLSRLETQLQLIQEAIRDVSVKNASEEPLQIEKSNGTTGDQICSRIPLYVVCRRGNDSQRAVQYLCSRGFHAARDIIGGLESWTKEIDPNFPSY